MKSRTLRASLRPGPSSTSTPVDTSTPQGRTRSIASATLSGVRPPARITRRLIGAPSANDQSNISPEPGACESSRIASAPNSSARSSAGSPAGKPLMTNGTFDRTSRVWSTVS
jgi:hypothetical protein